MNMTFYLAHCTGNAQNCLYPDRMEVASEAELAKAVQFDHVTAEYAGSYRNAANFILSDTVVMDLDNDHSEDPAEWIDPEKLDELLPDIAFAWAPSRHNYLQKGSLGPRPRGHVYFPIHPLTDGDLYAALKRSIHKAFPFFDENALDAARFIFGAETGDVVWHDGWISIDEELTFRGGGMQKEDSFITENEDELLMPDGQRIPEGTRNNTMHRFAVRVMIRHGVTEKARGLFLEHAKRCDPPLETAELRSIWNSAAKYAEEVQQRPDYIAPEDFDNDFADLCLKPGDYSDMGEARVLVDVYGSELLYTDATEFLRYDGMCWRENGHAALGAVEELLDLQLADAQDQMEHCVETLEKAGLDAGADTDSKAFRQQAAESNRLKELYALKAAQSYFKFILRYRNFHNLSNTLNTAKPMVAADVNDLDRDEFALNTPLATYDLRDGSCHPHNAADRITKITACAPGTDGKAIWEEALNTFFCKDRELIEYVQKIVGLSSIGKVYMEAMIIAYGSGRNGKSTFWNTISRVLGTYSGNMSADTLTVGCRRNVKPEMAELKGKRLIIAAELEEGMRLSTSLLKQLCSTDQVFAEKKFKAPFGFSPSHTLVLYTNFLPRVGVSDDGTWRRLIVIPFNAVIEGSGDIRNYSDYLFQNAGPAILQWIIEGAQKAIRCNYRFPLPKVVEQAIGAYRRQNDWLGHFLEECCEQGDNLTQKSGALYQEYRAFCMRTGEYIRSTADFYSALEAAGFVRRRQSEGNIIYGLQLKEQEFLS